MPARKNDNDASTDKNTETKKSPSKRTKKTSDETAVARGSAKRPASRKGKSGRNLVIVESPAKAKTIQKYLGGGFDVAASFGHVRDLAKRSTKGAMGIDIEGGWIPSYVLIKEKNKKDIISDLRKKADKAELVYLAPDPDREGEAIAWHLKETLNLEDERTRRVTFNEITKKAVEDAFEHSGSINMDLVRAQEARRFLDRVVGFTLSPLLNKKIVRGLSAGRVQSVAVRMVVEREREIEAFKSEEYWKIISHLTPAAAAEAKAVSVKVVKKKTEEEEDDPDADTEAEPDEDQRIQQPSDLKPESGKSFLAELAEWGGAKFKAGSEEAATEIAKVLESAEYVVSKIEQKDRQERPHAPFTTSTMQQQASIRLHKSASQTMQIAQKLYEGISLGEEGSTGLITYMRTDSTRISSDALRSVRELIGSEYGDAYLPEKPNSFASGKSAQEAHEAIRPTDLAHTPESIAPYLTKEQLELYDLIYRRFVASQMKPAVFAITNVEIKADKGLLKSQGKILKFDGYRKVLAPKGKQEDATLPELQDEQRLSLLDLLATQHFTQPPPRYNEASLVKALEKEGIGRPSTYASIISTIQKRHYVRQQKRRFYATPLGKLVTDKLLAHFPDVMDIKFTSQLEDKLDLIEEQKSEWKEVLDNFWKLFKQDLDDAQSNMEAVKGKEIGEECPQCGKPLVTRYSAKKGKEFVGCSGWPDCNYIKPDETDPEQSGPVETDYECPTCGKKMLRRMGPRGPFLGCSGYPECVTTMNFDQEGNPVVASKPTEHLCEKCGKPMVLREGRNGKFLGCSGYPKCRNLKEVDAQGNPVEPIITDVKCEKCGSPMQVKSGVRGPFLGCTNYPKCRSRKKMPEELIEKYKDRLPQPKQKPQIPKVDISEKCPECGADMELRQGRRGFFLGCSTYGKTKCKGTMQVPQEVKDQIEAKMTGAAAE